MLSIPRNTNHSTFLDSSHLALPAGTHDAAQPPCAPAPAGNADGPKTFDELIAELAQRRHDEDRAWAAAHPVPLPSDIGDHPQADIRQYLARLNDLADRNLDDLEPAEIMVLHRALREALTACRDEEPVPPIP